VGFILFALFFYLIYFLVKYLFIKPFREGYAAHGRRPRGTNWYQSSNTFQKRQEGEVTITYTPDQHRNGGKKVGDYVDYEEVD
tara:strand:- start:552 stop:800 length:249 start_codon:yes stop_codon:yes gene_type:complete